MQDLAPTPTLTALDRCDRCGAQAYFNVFLKSGGQLLFCAHHGAAHRNKLIDIASYIHDETEKLLTPRTTND